MNIIHVPESINDGKQSIFLVGPTPRNYLRNKDGSKVESWRPYVLTLIEKTGFNGSVFVPETRDGVYLGNDFYYTNQIKWEFSHLEKATAILAWIPRDIDVLPGFTTNIEFGYWLRNEKLFYGRPDKASKTKYLDWMYETVRCRQAANTIDMLVGQVLEFLHNRT